LIKYTSGLGDCSVLPPNLKKWNWGAFWLPWIWGIGNGTYIALLAMIPIVNIFMAFYLGRKGYELAWKNKSWSSVEELNRVQKKWGKTAFIISIVFYSIVISIKVEEYIVTKQTMEMTNEVIYIISSNDEASHFLKKDYKVISSSFMFYKDGYKTSKPTEFHMLITSDDTFIDVDVKIDNNKNVKEISMKEWNSDNEYVFQLSYNSE